MDEHLTWDPSKYGGLDEIVFSFYEVWTPDITHWNSITLEKRVKRTHDRSSVFVYSNGTVLWAPLFDLTASCRGIDMTNYPWDSHKCNIFMGSWIYSIKEIEYHVDTRFYPNGVYTDLYRLKEFEEFQLVNGSLETYLVNDIFVMSGQNLTLWITRRSSYYIWTIKVPNFLAGLVHLVTFMTTRIDSMTRVLTTVISLTLVEVSSFYVNNFLLKNIHSISVPFIVKSLSANIFLLSVNIVIWRLLTYFCYLNCPSQIPPNSSESSRLSQISRGVHRVTSFVITNPFLHMLFCTPFLEGITSKGEEDDKQGLFPSSNSTLNRVFSPFDSQTPSSLTTGVSSITTDDSQQQQNSGSSTIVSNMDGGGGETGEAVAATGVNGDGNSAFLTYHSLAVIIDRLLFVIYFIFFLLCC